MDSEKIKLTYKDFKIGQKVTCTKNMLIDSKSGQNNDWWVERLDIGKEYIIDDLDWHFQDSMAVKLDSVYYKHIEFVPIEFFYDDVAEKREKKLNQLLDEPVQNNNQL